LSTAPAPQKELPLTGSVAASWLDRASGWRLRMLVALLTLLFFGVNLFAERLLMWEFHRTVRIIILSDAAVSLVIGYLALKLIELAAERRRLVAERVRTIAELNHHIRNGLETIALSVYTTHNQDAIQTIYSAVNRIDWALREIVPSEPAVNEKPKGEKEQEAREKG
jgi:hypothetical protein